MPGSNAGPGGNPPTWGCPADLNGDWLVDDTDFAIFVASYNRLEPGIDALASGGGASGGGASGGGASGDSLGGALAWGPGWNGYWFDPATGLWLSRHRWYDPRAGRWITWDPAGYVDGLSLYLYVKGNPFLFRDPSGLYTLSEWGQIGGAFLQGAVEGKRDIDRAIAQKVNQVGAFIDDVATTAAAIEYSVPEMLTSPAQSNLVESQSRGSFLENATMNLAAATASPIAAPLGAANDLIDSGINSFNSGEPMGEAAVNAAGLALSSAASFNLANTPSTSASRALSRSLPILNGSFVPNMGKVVANIAQRELNAMKSNPAIRASVLSRKEMASPLKAANDGIAVERLTANVVDQDPTLSSILARQGGPGKPDFAIKQPLPGNKPFIELTTRRAWPAHQNRPYAPQSEPALYCR